MSAARRSMGRCAGVGAALALALGVGATALAGGLARLPARFVFPRGEGSPGPVAFSHGSHVDPERPDCTRCHPRLFRILEPGAPAEGGPVRHDLMKRGRACGACHDDERTFGLEDCALCHEGG